MINGKTGEAPELVVMLTYNDFTVEDAAEVFGRCSGSKAKFWGMKEKPLAPEKMQALYAEMRRCGVTTALEVVAYDEAEGLRGAECGRRCGCDILMGTKFFPSIARYCSEHGIKYMPFVGTIEGRPSVLTGSIDEIIAEAQYVVANGAYGVDLLGYRYTGDATALCRELVAAVDAPVCIAGSIDSPGRLDEVCRAGAAMFTVGSAFFDHKFGTDMLGQINEVCNHVAEASQRPGCWS